MFFEVETGLTAVRSITSPTVAEVEHTFNRKYAYLHTSPPERYCLPAANVWLLCSRAHRVNLDSGLKPGMNEKVYNQRHETCSPYLTRVGFVLSIQNLLCNSVFVAFILAQLHPCSLTPPSQTVTKVTTSLVTRIVCSTVCCFLLVLSKTQWSQVTA